MRFARWIVWIATTMLLAGCVPERYSWSPDGRCMTVLSPTGLSFADAEGNLLAPTIRNATLAAWFPDGKRILVCRDVDATTWDALAAALSTQQIKTLGATGQHALDLATTYDWSSTFASWSDFDAHVFDSNYTSGQPFVDNEMAPAIGLYLRDHATDALRQKIPPEHWHELEAFSQNVRTVQVYTIDQTSAKPAATLIGFMNDVYSMRLSPTGAAAVISVKSSASDAESNLWVVATDGVKPAIQLSTAAACFPDFTADGHDVVFISTEEHEQLAYLSRATVVGADGTLVDQPVKPDDLAILLYSASSRVRCLKDGRIIFATPQLALPAPGNDLNDRATLYVMTPGNPVTISKFLPDKVSAELGDSAEYFAISPDATHVSIPDQTGKVTVVDLASGAVTQVQPDPVHASEGSDNALATVPAWRNSDELTFIAPADNGQRRVVLWSVSKNQGKTLSTQWPAAMTKDH